MQIPRCPKNFSATFICVDINCNQSNPFICHNTQNHDCYLSHQNCNKKKWNQFRYQLEKTKNLAHPQFIKFSKIVQDTISNCIKNLQTQFVNFKMWKLTFGMSPQIIYFLKCLHDNKQKCWTGNQLAQIIEQIEGKQKFKKFDELKIQNFCKKVLDQIQEIKKTIKKMYMSLEQQLQNNYIDINPKFNKLEVIKIDLTRSSVELSKPMIKILPLIQSQSITIKIKQKLLLDLNQRLFNLSQKPTHLELKFKGHTGFPTNCYSAYMRLNEMANNLKKSNFKGLRNIILYYPWIIGDNPDFIRCQKQIASAISPIHLPNLVSFTILANDIKSVQGFKVIQNKVQIIREWGWVDKEIW